jgi:D-3-phosphoglycerate dehydrogenase
MDSVDLQTAEQLGIKVTNTPDAPTIPVAELTLGMILSLLRKIHISDSAIRSAKWVRPMGNLLFDKTVGLIGCGRIGTCVGKLLSAFGCKVQGFDPFVKESTHIKLVDFDSVMSGSDMVSLHIPYTKDNHHILGRQAIAQMKKGSYVINASRGGLVDEAALYDLLVSGHLGGAALDCFEKEPYAGKLTGLDNVLLTGHIGSYAIEGRNMQERQALDNLLANL